MRCGQVIMQTKSALKTNYGSNFELYQYSYTLFQGKLRNDSILVCICIASTCSYADNVNHGSCYSWAESTAIATSVYFAFGSIWLWGTCIFMRNTLLEFLHNFCVVSYNSAFYILLSSKKQLSLLLTLWTYDYTTDVICSKHRKVVLAMPCSYYDFHPRNLGRHQKLID